MSKYSFLVKHFLSRGLKIFPITPNAKTPLIDKWQFDSSCEREQLLYWLEYGGNNINFALPASVNDLFIIDIDMHGDVDGLSSFKKLCHDCQIDFDSLKTMEQITPSGGIHLVFKTDDELKKVRNTANSFGEKYPGIDIRTSGYILIAPSVIDGTSYTLVETPDKIVEMPQKLRSFILENANASGNIVKKGGVKEFSIKDKVQKGSRDEEIFSYINYLYNNTKLGQEEISLLAHYYNSTSFEPKLPNSVIDYKVRKIFERPRSEILVVRLNTGDDLNEW